jgi:hypothetical protein
MMAYPLSLRHFRCTCSEIIEVCDVMRTKEKISVNNGNKYSFLLVATIKTCNKWFTIYIKAKAVVSLNHFEI